MEYPLTAKRRFPMTKMRWLRVYQPGKDAAGVMKASEKYGFPTNSCGFSPHYFWQKRQKSYRGGVPAFPPGCSAKRQARLSGDSKEETV